MYIYTTSQKYLVTAIFFYFSSKKFFFMKQVKHHTLSVRNKNFLTGEGKFYRLVVYICMHHIPTIYLPGCTMFRKYLGSDMTLNKISRTLFIFIISFIFFV